MMPGAVYPGRRQSEYHYHVATQNHSPVPHNPYLNYQYPHHQAYPQPSSYTPQWYNPYHQLPTGYPIPPRAYQPHHSPVVVSSHPHVQPLPPTRPLTHTPPIVHSRTPPVGSSYTPHPAPSTPSATSQVVLSPATPTTPMTAFTPPPPSSTPQRTAETGQPQPPSQPARKMPFYPPLPWLSVPEEPFPPRALRSRRRRRARLVSFTDSLQLPRRNESPEPKVPSPQENASKSADTVHNMDGTASTGAVPPLPSAEPAPLSPHKQPKTVMVPAVPLVQVKSGVSTAGPTEDSPKDGVAGQDAETVAASDAPEASKAPIASNQGPSNEVPPARQGPKSWADLVRTKTSATMTGPPIYNGVGNSPAISGGVSLADALRTWSVDSDKKLAFLEPRGLVNTGNMCYMNSVLQILLFCTPFYDFLDQIGKRAVHSFKSETPLLDAMIMFMRDFKVIDSAVSAEQLRLRLKDNELEQYGEPLIPEYVYDVIKRLPRFSHMRRGHQQDAEEFLGFLLAGLHDECAHMINATSVATADDSSPKSDEPATTDGWMEVGPKQKAAITRTSGTVDESPITRIFGGKLRSELRVPGLKNSVTLEPYQPLQLDIGSPEIQNISDALRGLTRSETLTGDFNSPRGPGTSATKQVFIENLPPVLILHLKRFQYDNAGGTQKIWKKIGYPLELEIPREVFPPHKRASLAAHGGSPRYQLTGVVYHHGKNATGGHYTVDTRRQDGREWIRLDDTVIRRVRPEDVAEGGSEENPRVLAAALEQHKRDAAKAQRNIYEAAAYGAEDEDSEKGEWNQVHSAASTVGGARKGTAAAAAFGGASTAHSPTGKGTPAESRSSVKDNKVAYILFYQQIR